MKILTRENYTEVLSDRGNISRTKIEEWKIGEFSELPDITKVEVIYMFKHNLQGRPKCTCGNDCRFSGTTTTGYRGYCSKICSRNSNISSTRYITREEIPNCYSKSGKLRWKYTQQFKIPENLTWCSDIIEAIYCLEHNIYKQPICKECEEPTKFKGTNKGYTIYCCTTCSNGSEDVKKNKIQSMISKFGVEDINDLHWGLNRDLSNYSKGKHHKSYLYVMKSKNLEKFKIGVSIQPKRRFDRIKSESNIPDLELVETIHISYAYIYEYFLHKKYNTFKSPISEGSGRNEWFSMICYNQTLDEIRNYRD